MTTKQADKIIAVGEPVRVYSECYCETFDAKFIRRDRYNIYSEDGGVFDRADLRLAGVEVPQ